MTFEQFVESKDKINIGYFGGSITSGSGASTPDFCFRNLVTKYLNEKYPKTTFTGIDAAIGGTGSNLGLFRMDNDLMSKNPDFVFIEFAVNDSKLETTDVYMENIVRKILKVNPKMPIVFLYTVTQATIDEGYKNGKLPMAVEKHEALAKYYNIPTLNIGLALYEKMQETGKDIKAFTIDTVHPNNEGYAIYTDFITSHISDLDFNIVFPEKSMTGIDYGNAKMVLTEGYAKDGWKLSVNKMYRTLPNYIYSNVPGTKLTYEFEGSVIGLYFTMEKDSGNLVYAIDGGEEKLCRTWDKYCKNFNRDCYEILDDKLEYGKHRIEMRISDTKEEESEGTYVRIGAFLVG